MPAWAAAYSGLTGPVDAAIPPVGETAAHRTGIPPQAPSGTSATASVGHVSSQNPEGDARPGNAYQSSRYRVWQASCLDLPSEVQARWRGRR